MRKTVKRKGRNTIRTLLALCFSSALLFSCKEIQYVPVVTTDTVYVNKVSKDTVFCRDSVIIHSKGDTVYCEKYKYVYKDKILVDTVHQTSIIEKPVEVVKTVEVPKKLSLLDKIFMTIGIISTSLLVVWLIHKFRK